MPFVIKSKAAISFTFNIHCEAIAALFFLYSISLSDFRTLPIMLYCVFLHLCNVVSAYERYSMALALVF